MKHGLVIISNRLPISVKKTDCGLEFFSSIGGLATGLARFAEEKMNRWIGWPGISTDQLTNGDKDEIIAHFAEHNCYPVFLSQKQIDDYYSGYSNRILWPLCHNLPINPSALKYQGRYWKSYKEVNQLFADTILDLCPPNSNFWVHDYHLLLLPQLLRQQRPESKIGFFQHIPFPKPDNFIEIADCESIIDGLLGADLIGFHINDYVNDFIDSCKKIEIGKIKNNQITTNRHTSTVSNFPMGINYTKFANGANSIEVKREINNLQKIYENIKVIITVDRLDPSKGLVERAKAYRDFLRQNPKLHEKVVLIMQAMPSRTKIEEYITLHQQLTNIIDDINDEFGTLKWEPIKYMYTCLTFNELQALYRIADIAFIAPLCDGMNLVAKEYVASKNKTSGVLILSESAGVAKELTDAVIVSHKNPSSLVEGLNVAINMPISEQQTRLIKMDKQIEKSNVENWYHNFVEALFNTKQTKPKLHINWVKNLAKAYKSAKNRCILLDYDGTLAPFVDDPDKAIPTDNVKKILTLLASKENNKVTIISGREKTNLGIWFKDVPINLVAEHGSFVRNSNSNQWQSTISFDNSWKEQIRKICEKCIKKVSGSFIEDKNNSLVCHYRTANLDLAHEHLATLKDNLFDICKQHNLKIEQGNMIVEIRPKGIDKGIIAKDYSKDSDFILAIGDDTTDEEMFKALKFNKDAWTIKVRFGKTAAKYRLEEVDDVIKFLLELSKI